jgi:3-oxoacyl-[acyl-carrier-protein] synthase-3
MDGRPAFGRFGIAAISVYEPAWVLENAWYGDTIPRKFVHHTGIEARPISQEDEVTMAVRAVKGLQRETGCDLADCAGLVFVSPSFVPLAAARRFLNADELRRERLSRAARQVARRLAIGDVLAVGINWFCSGYAKAISLAAERILPRIDVGTNQYLLVVTASRISRITDYSCKQSGALFGDLATVTMLSRTDSTRYPVHLEVLHAAAEKRPAEGVFFDFHRRTNVLAPADDGGKVCEPERVVFSLDGMGIADAAPRAMADALASSLAAAHVAPADVRYVVPHQAGAGIVRFTAMKVEQLGVSGEVIQGHTKRIGNVSSGSIPYALQRSWSRLSGTIGCPTAAVGDPGTKEVSQGCVLLRATRRHERLARTAA